MERGHESVLSMTSFLHITPQRVHTCMCKDVYHSCLTEKPLSRHDCSLQRFASFVHPPSSNVCNTIKNFIAKEKDAVHHLRSFSYMGPRESCGLWIHDVT